MGTVLPFRIFRRGSASWPVMRPVTLETTCGGSGPSSSAPPRCSRPAPSAPRCLWTPRRWVPPAVQRPVACPAAVRTAGKLAWWFWDTSRAALRWDVTPKGWRGHSEDGTLPALAKASHLREPGGKPTSVLPCPWHPSLMTLTAVRTVS